MYLSHPCAIFIIDSMLIFVSLLRHFTIRGADDTDFAGGVYHGRIMVSVVQRLWRESVIILGINQPSLSTAPSRVSVQAPAHYFLDTLWKV